VLGIGGIFIEWAMVDCVSFVVAEIRARFIGEGERGEEHEAIENQRQTETGYFGETGFLYLVSPYSRTQLLWPSLTHSHNAHTHTHTHIHTHTQSV